MTCGRLVTLLSCVAVVLADESEGALRRRYSLKDVEGAPELLAEPEGALRRRYSLKDVEGAPELLTEPEGSLRRRRHSSLNDVEGELGATDLEEEPDDCRKEGCGTINYIKGGCWMLAIALMFFAQHHVCDAYFVPAINVFVRKMKSSPSPAMQRWGEEAVAGATICALGCNGPELFSNLISLFTHSDAGIGVVVGSEIFNLLIIVGAATLCAPTTPLQLEKAPFIRDVFFYALSIGLLYWTLMDKSVAFSEACILLAAAGVYVVVVYFTTDIAAKVSGPAEEVEDAPPADNKKKGKMHGVEVAIEEVIHSRMTDARCATSAKFTLDPTEAGIYAEPKGGPMGKTATKATSRASLGFQFDAGDPMLGNMLRYKDLKEVLVLSEGVIELEFQPNVFQHVSLKITVADSEQRDMLLDNIKKYSLGRTWVHKYNAGPSDAIQHFMHTMHDKSAGCVEKLMAFPHVFIDFMLRMTLFAVDVKDIKYESRWAACFLGAMCWLATFSFCMLEVANFINWNIPALPISFLGITVCAIGTSFPNAVASILMAQQNKPGAAIANALGSNVQNVFLAMALPWIIFSAATLNCGPIPQNVVGINEGVVWMCFTLALLVFFAMLPQSFSLQKWHGYVLASMYVVYLALTSAEAFGVMAPLMK